ncbi:LacI family DNA-binding transcriptional regulator [Providencia huaxiensis]
MEKKCLLLTVKDVARLANVSQSAVSLVFSGRYQGRSI